MSSDTNAWPLKPLSEVVDFNPRLDKSAYRDDLEVSFVPMAAVSAGSGRIEVSQKNHFSKVKKGYTPFQENDILFAKITPCMENGKMAVVPKLSNGLGFGSTEFHVLRPHEGIDSRYIYYFVSSQSFRREAAHRMTGAVGQKRVPLSFLEETLIPVPIFDDQKRIVAEIEKQFSRLDEAVANLKRVKANLKRYKAAVLKAAVEGKLTEDWRVEAASRRLHSEYNSELNPDQRQDAAATFEPASKLLDRILTERRANWKGKGKYKEPSAPEKPDWPLLPKGWRWATVEQLSMLVQYGSSAKTHEEAIGVPVLRMGNIEDARLRLDSLKYLPKNHNEFPGLFLREGDILFNRTNSAELVGKTAVFKGKPAPCSFASYLIRVRLIRGCAPDLLAYFINSVFGRAWIAQVVSQQVGQANVNGTKLQALAVPLPPLVEQEEIIAEVERRLSVIDALETTVEANLTRANRLRQSILAQAFSGKLLLNDADYHA